MVKFPYKQRPQKRRRGIYRDNILQFKQREEEEKSVYCPGCGQEVFTDEDKRIALETWKLIEKNNARWEAERE